MKSMASKLLERLDKTNESSSFEDSYSDVDAFRKELENDPTNKKIKQLAHKFGYEAGWCFMTSYGTPVFQIRTPRASDYHPEIYAHFDSDDDEKGFFIQTSSVGAIKQEEYAEFLKCCTDAFKFVNELSKIDVNKLPVKKF